MCGVSQVWLLVYLALETFPNKKTNTCSPRNLVLLVLSRQPVGERQKQLKKEKGSRLFFASSLGLIQQLAVDGVVPMGRPGFKITGSEAGVWVVFFKKKI